MWKWARTSALRRDDRPAPRPPGLAANEFLDQARWAAAWQWQRADSLERKAAQLLGFSGVLLVLLPTSIDSVAAISHDGVRVAAKSVLVVAILALVGSAGLAVSALATRHVSTININQLQEMWRDQRDGARKSADAVIGSFVEALLVTADRKQAPVAMLAFDADRRAKRTRQSARALYLAVILTGSMLLLLLTGR